MKNLLAFLTMFFIAITLFAQKDMPENAGHKNLPEEVFLINYHENDIIHKQLLEEEKHLGESKKNSSETTYKGKANEQDSLALVALYNATDGDNWNDNTNWLTGNVSTWYGIILDGNGRVTEIDLSGSYGNHFNMVGSIPAEIGNLTDLTDLNLGYNELSGTIPYEIGNLTSLCSIFLNDNQLTDSIPAEIGNLTNLESLYLHRNQLTGNSIPPEIGNLTNLMYLNLSSNQITGSIPSEIGNLINLRSLYLSSNQLIGSIPTGICNLASLQIINFFNNQLIGSIPPEIGNLTSLMNLNLSFNQLTGSIPPEIGNLTGLTTIYLFSNQLTGSIPAEIGNLTGLTMLHLSSNQLTGSIPTVIGTLTNLQNLYLDNNQFDELQDLSALTNLINLYIYNNKFTFEDIEPNINVGDFFHYSPQANVGIVEYYTLNAGDNLDLTVTVGGTANTYQWYKDNVAISGATSSTYPIINYSSGDAGIYMCKINNTIATELTLESENIYVSTEVAISELENEISFTLYPNPARDIVNIQLNNIEDNNIQLNMYDFYGRKIKINTDKFYTDRIQINVSDKSAGIYYLQIISTGKFSETIKLIITE